MIGGRFSPCIRLCLLGPQHLALDDLPFVRRTHGFRVVGGAVRVLEKFRACCRLETYFGFVSSDFSTIPSSEGDFVDSALAIPVSIAEWIARINVTRLDEILFVSSQRSPFQRSRLMDRAPLSQKYRQ